MDILTVDFKDKDAGPNFIKSLHETGFAVVKNHDIDYGLVKQVFDEWRDFFASDAKYQYPYNKSKGDGYVSSELSETAKGADVPDIKEFFQVYQPWGRFPQELTNNTLIYFRQVLKLAKGLLKWVDDYSPLEVKKRFSEPLVNMSSLERTMLRILHYPPFKGGECNNAVRAAAHEDINLLTLLPASNKTGLQVKTKNDTWVDIGTNEGEFIVNVGDMLQECSNFYYISTTHRVVNPDLTKSNGARFSMPLFLHPKSDAYLSQKYTRADDYLNERLAELGLSD